MHEKMSICVYPCGVSQMYTRSGLRDLLSGIKNNGDNLKQMMHILSHIS